MVHNHDHCSFLEFMQNFSFETEKYKSFKFVLL